MDIFSFQPGLMFWTLVTFAVLVAVLGRFAFRPLQQVLREREARIRESLDKAQEARAEAQTLLDRNAAQLAEARNEARKIVNEGHRIVADMRREAHDRAKSDADVIVSQARAEIDRELQRSLDELRGTVAGLSVRIARQVVRTQVDEKEHERLANDFIERLKKTHAGKRS